MSIALNAGLYAITDPLLLDSQSLLSSVESVLAGGCSVIQYRDKLASDAERLQRARALKRLCDQYHAQLIINDDLKLCLDSQADGVHLGKSDGDILHARNVLGREHILGVTCHSDLNYAQKCIAEGVDYCAFGRIFPSLTKPDAPHCSLSILKQALTLSKPVVAIGGITLDNIGLLMQTPVHNVAVIHGLFSQTDIQATAHQFQEYFSKTSKKQV
tara:strand:+ start:3112 stop:3756 length:645 start_codon:yes stop_codon:yes gene_type:complete